MAQAEQELHHRFNELMNDGREALSHGRIADAHRIWRQAATLDPYSEQVWLALLEIVQDDKDQRVCLENIVQINPRNVQARRQLNKLDAREQQLAEIELKRQAEQLEEQQRKRKLIVRALLLGVTIGLSGTLFGVLASILVYGGG